MVALSIRLTPTEWDLSIEEMLMTALCSSIVRFFTRLNLEEYQRGVRSSAWIMNQIINVFLGLPFAFACAAVSWVLVDTMMLVVSGGSSGFMKIWSASSSFSMFIAVIDQCGLAKTFFVRTESILFTSILLIGFRVGDQMRLLIAVRARPVLSMLIVPFSMTLLVGMVVDLPPTVIPDSSSCSYPSFDQSGPRWWLY